MFDFIKRLFKKEEKVVPAASPVVVHAEVEETIVIKEVALAEVKKKPAKSKVVAKGVKPAKEKPVVDNVVPLVQPKAETPAKPKKPAKPKRVVIDESFSLVPPATPKPKPKGRPKKDKTV